MRPVRVTTQGASLSLPLRMAAVGTGVTVGITIWVVSDGRYEPQNFPFFHIDDSALVWDFSTNLSNYTTLRTQNETALGGKGWEIESSLTLNQQLITSVILSGGQYYGGSGGFGGGVQPWTPWPSRNAGDGSVRRRPPDMFCKGLQVLHDGCEVELVARTGEPPQAHALESMVGLEVCKAHLDLLALVA